MSVIELLESERDYLDRNALFTLCAVGFDGIKLNGTGGRGNLLP